MANLGKPVKEPQLVSGILHICTTPSTHAFSIRVGTENGMKKYADDRAGDLKKIEDDTHCHILPMDVLATYPQRMESSLKRHFNESGADVSAPATALVGDAKYFVHKKGNTAIAAAIEYYPKGKDDKRVRGINPVPFEIKILEHLRDTEGVTHVTSQDGITMHVRGKNNNSTSKQLRDMLKARGIEWNKIYPIGEWIGLLKEPPDYSKIKK